MSANLFWIDNIAMSGSWVTVTVPGGVNSVMVQMRETDVPMQIKNPGEERYFTLAAGGKYGFESFNMAGCQFAIKAESGIAEIVGGLVT